MATVIITIIVMALVIFVMAIGVILGRKPIQGSCGGSNGSGSCEMCSGGSNSCKNKAKKKE